MKTYACVYLGSTVLALLSTPIVGRIARFAGLVDHCSPRKVHTLPVPRIGGLAIIAPMLAMSTAAILLDNAIGQELRSNLTQVIALLAGGVFIAAVGLIDDIRSLPPSVKFAGQIVAGLGVCAFGIRIDSITVSGVFAINFGWMGWVITVLWIVGITNAVNLIDGLDGLAAGISAATCGVIAVLSFYNGQPVMAVLMLALLGSLTGFLRYNFHPARIFMGDCGSLFLGFILAGASVLCAMKSATIVGLALPGLALGIPIFDTLSSVVRRFLERRSICTADRSHIHHRLLESGFRQPHIVIAMYAVTLAATGAGMFMIFLRDVGALIVLGSVLILLVVVFRIAGSFTSRHPTGNVKEYLAAAREVGKDKRCFEHAELRLARALSFEDWWTGIAAAAEEMGFSRISVSLRNETGASRTLTRSGNGNHGSRGDGIVRFERTIRDERGGQVVRIKAEIPAQGSLESSGRRLALLGRLIDRHGGTEAGPMGAAA